MIKVRFLTRGASKLKAGKLLVEWGVYVYMVLHIPQAGAVQLHWDTPCKFVQSGQGTLKYPQHATELWNLIRSILGVGRRGDLLKVCSETLIYIYIYIQTIYVQNISQQHAVVTNENKVRSEE